MKLRKTGNSKYQIGLEGRELHYLAEAINEAKESAYNDVVRMAKHFGVSSDVWKFFQRRLAAWEKFQRDIDDGISLINKEEEREKG